MIESQNLYSRMRSEGSRFTLGGWGLRLCLPDVAQPSATVRNRSQPSARGRYGRASGEFCKSGHFWRFQTSRSLVSRGRRGTLWHSNMFHNAGAIYCSVVFRRWVALFVTGAALWIPWQAWHLAACDENWRKPRTKHRFGVANFEVQRKTRRRKTSILWLHSVKGSLPRNASFEAPTCGLSCGLSVSIGKAAKPLLSKVSKQLHPLPEV